MRKELVLVESRIKRLKKLPSGGLFFLLFVDGRSGRDVILCWLIDIEMIGTPARTREPLGRVINFLSVAPPAAAGCQLQSIA